MVIKIDIDYLMKILEWYETSVCEWPEEEDDGGVLAKIGLVARPSDFLIHSPREKQL